MRRPWVGVLVIVVIAGLAAAARAGAQEAGLSGSRSVAPAQLAQMLTSKDFFLVNVLPTYEGEIPQTDAFISYQDTRARLTDYPRDKAAKIVVYCLTGRVSALAQRDLMEAGYTDVLVLEGGLREWAREARTVLHRNDAPAVPYPAAAPQPGGPVPEGCPCGLGGETAP